MSKLKLFVDVWITRRKRYFLAYSDREEPDFKSRLFEDMMMVIDEREIDTLTIIGEERAWSISIVDRHSKKEIDTWRRLPHRY